MMRASHRVMTIVVAALMFVSGGEQVSARTKRKTVVPVDVALGGARLVRFRGTIAKVAVADPAVAEARQADGRSLQVVGKQFGETTILVWDGRSTPTRLVVTVGVPTEGLTHRLKAIFPDEVITAEGLGDAIVLKGTVSDPVIAERAARLAAAYSQGGKKKIRVLNFLDITGRQQVQLRVKVAEVSRTALRAMGVNLLFSQSGSNAFGGAVASPSTPVTSESFNSGGGSNGSDGSGSSGGGVSGALSSGLGLLLAPLGGSAYGLHFGGTFTSGNSALSLGVAISLLQGRGLAKVLSEPTLVAYSGQEAKFLAGGELPIPVAQSLNANTIEYKPYGVQLTFTPTVLGGRTIHLRVSVSVSEVDTTQSVGGVPALTSRHTETTVRLRNGQSFAVAGLLQDSISASSSKVPLLGDIPILGMFFREKQFRRQERELVVLVTTNLVRPLKPGEVPPLPGEDEVSDPGAVAFFLLGSIDPELEGEVRSQPAGPVGYSK